MANPKVKFKYYFDNDYDPDYINGVYGGVNANGELIAHFFTDRTPIPYEESYNLNEDGSLGELTDTNLTDDITIRRVVKNGLVMNQETAVSVYRWLQAHLREMGVAEDDL